MSVYKIKINKKKNFLKNQTVFFNAPKIFFLLIIFIVAAMNSCAPKPKQQEYITIGALLPLTGKDSDEGLRAFNGLHLAKDEINESGGVLGKMIDIIVLNDKGDEEYIVQQYNALKEKNVIAIIGSSYSGATLVLAKESEKEGLPVISPTASNPDVTQGRRNVFRAIFIDDYQAEVMAKFAIGSLNARTAVVLNNDAYDNFKRTSGIFSQSFTDLGGRVIAMEHYSAGDNFADVLGKYTANPPDVIFCPEDYVLAAKLVNTAYEIGLKKTYILGTDAWDGLLAYVYHPDAMENVFYSSPFSYDDNDPAVMRFVKTYFNTFSQMPLAGSAAAYTCVYILANAIEKAGNTNKDDLISAIKLNELELITGHIKFDENNNPHINVYIIRIKGGVYSTYEKLSL